MLWRPAGRGRSGGGWSQQPGRLLGAAHAPCPARRRACKQACCLANALRHAECSQHGRHSSWQDLPDAGRQVHSGRCSLAARYYWTAKRSTHPHTCTSLTGRPGNRCCAAASASASSAPCIGTAGRLALGSAHTCAPNGRPTAAHIHCHLTHQQPQAHTAPRPPTQRSEVLGGWLQLPAHTMHDNPTLSAAPTIAMVRTSAHHPAVHVLRRGARVAARLGGLIYKHTEGAHAAMGLAGEAGACIAARRRRLICRVTVMHGTSG